ncbi:hypothetical protein [Streptomyces sp. NPDC003877]
MTDFQRRADEVLRSIGDGAEAVHSAYGGEPAEVYRSRGETLVAAQAAGAG